MILFEKNFQVYQHLLLISFSNKVVTSIDWWDFYRKFSSYTKGFLIGSSFYSSRVLYSQVPNKREVLIDRGSEKIPKFNKRGVKIDGEVGIREKALSDYTKTGHRA